MYKIYIRYNNEETIIKELEFNDIESATRFAIALINHKRLKEIDLISIIRL